MSGDRAFRSNWGGAYTLYITLFILPPSAPPHLSTLPPSVFLRSATRFLKLAVFILCWNISHALSVIKSESWLRARWHLLKLCDSLPHPVKRLCFCPFVVRSDPGERERLFESLSHKLLRFELLRPRLLFGFLCFVFFFDGVFGFSAIAAPVSVTLGVSEVFGTSCLLRVTTWVANADWVALGLLTGFSVDTVSDTPNDNVSTSWFQLAYIWPWYCSDCWV